MLPAPDQVFPEPSATRPVGHDEALAGQGADA
jgi:hypothetical protein